MRSIALILALISLVGCSAQYKNFQVSNEAYHPYAGSRKAFSLRKDYGSFDLEAYCQRVAEDREFQIHLIFFNHTNSSILADFSKAKIWPNEEDSKTLVYLNNRLLNPLHALIPSDIPTTVTFITKLEAGYNSIPLTNVVTLMGIDIIIDPFTDKIELEKLEFRRIDDEK